MRQPALFGLWAAFGAAGLALASPAAAEDFGDVPPGCEAGIRRAAAGGVLFASGRSEIAPESLGVVEAVATIALGCPEAAISVSGHTDSDGSEGRNLELSLKRASSVAELIVAGGVAPARVTAVGHGESRPLAANDTPEGRARNRRIEFVVHEAAGAAED